MLVLVLLPILLQVNAGEDPAKFGVSVEETPGLLLQALECEGLQVDGFMTIAPFALMIKRLHPNHFADSGICVIE